LQTRDPSPRQTSRSTSTNPQLSGSNKNQAMDRRWLPDTKTKADWPSVVPYKESSIICGTGADILSKTNFGRTGHHHYRRSSLPRVCTVSSASTTF
jgi:hypothetical protein